MNKLLEKYKEKLKNPKTLIIIGLAGIILIFFSSFITGKDTGTEPNNIPQLSIEEYRTSLEKSIKEIVKEITGSKNATVVVTLESGLRYKYANVTEGSSADKTESDTVSTSSEIKQGYITVKTPDGGEQALLITTQMPEIRGVAIVCVGGDNAVITEKIENAVTAALNITSQRVHIAGGN